MDVSASEKKPIDYERLVGMWGRTLDRTTAPLTRKAQREQKKQTG